MFHVFREFISKILFGRKFDAFVRMGRGMSLNLLTGVLLFGT